MTPATRSRLIILTGAAALVLVFLHVLGALSGAEAWVMRKFAPHEFRLANAARSLRDAAGAPFRASAALSENESLRRERSELLAQVADLRKLEEENSDLRELLAFSKREKKPPILAKVIASEPGAGAHTVLLDMGSDEGILPDMPVVAGDGVIVGRIFKLTRSTATALLLTDTRSRVGASALNDGRTQGVVQGKRGLSLEMRLIPQNEPIAPGDIVVTSGIEPQVPRGLVIGRVQQVESQEKNPFKTAIIGSPVQYDRLDIVAIPRP